jgi:hypothetical protein
MAITGGTPNFTIAGASNVPPGLTPYLQNWAVHFKGVVNTSGTYNGSITLRDSTGAKTTQPFSIIVNRRLIAGALTRTNWTANAPGYTGTITLTGGTGPLSIITTNGLPDGLSPVIFDHTISFTGAPTTPGVYQGSITVQDAIGVTRQMKFGITIAAPPTIGDLTVTQWKVGVAGFTGTLTINGGTPSFSLITVDGLPTGMSATVIGRVIKFKGTPTDVGPFDGSITVQDASGTMVTQTFEIDITT